MFHVKRKRVAFRCSAGACLLCRRLPLPLVCLSAPIPPLPPFPAGRGRFFALFCRGLAPPAPLLLNRAVLACREAPPLASPGLSPDGIGFFCRVSAFLPPIPPTPFPRGEGEIFGLFCRGWRPRHPCYRSRAVLAYRKAPPLASPWLSPGGAGYAFRTQAHKILSKHPLIRNALVNAYL